jgi:hypothetical protein
LSESRGYIQILKAASASLDHPGPVPADAAEKIAYAVDRESQSVASVFRLVPKDRVASMKGAIQPMLDGLRRFGEIQSTRIRDAAGGVMPVMQPDPRQAAASKIVVKRKRFGTLPLDDLPHEQWEGYPSGAWAALPTIALYWCDGKRNLAEVIRLTRLELGPSDFDFIGYFRFLARHGYVEISE